VTVRSSEVVPAAAFSPDGRHLAFVTSAPESIQVAATDGSSLERTFASSKLYLNGTGGLAWPAPGRLLFGQQADDPGSASLCEIAIDDDGRALGAPRELWKGRASAIESLSTHDETIAAVVMRMHAEVRVADLAVGGLRRTGAPRRFTGTEVNCQDAAWLPDGRLGFFSDRDGKGVLYAQASESAPVTLLVPGEVVPNRLAWAGTEALRTGELIYPRAESPSQPGVRRMVVAGPGGAERELLRTSAPDESWMVRCASGDPHQCVVGKVVGHSITLSPLDAGRGEVGPAFFTGAGVTSFALSPDGKTVVVIDRSPRLTVVDRATGQTRSETTTPGARFFQDAAFTPDGRWLVVSGLEFDDDAYGLAAYDMEGRGAMLVTSRDQWLSGPRVSPDGRRLAYTAKAFAADVWLLEPQTSTTGVRSRM
jgi:dipeptidyl aminopeptidase/acylaminoacyl peptidase